MASKRHLRRKACTGKRAYTTLKDAVRAASVASGIYLTRMNAYRCPFGAHYHVGHLPANVRKEIYERQEHEYA